MEVLTFIGGLFGTNVLRPAPAAVKSWTPPSAVDLIKQHGYPVESHYITTADGYILTYHRIPHGKETPDPSVKREPVLLQHGMLQSSADWVLSHDSLGYLLADTGFDVWMGNSRGNTYSRKHVSLNPDKDKKAFWDFSWHEMGYFDLPAGIDYILGMTNQHKLFYVGTSMGTTMFLVLGATRPEYMSKVKAVTLMAPMAYPWHIPSPVVKFILKVSSFFKHISINYDLLSSAKTCKFCGPGDSRAGNIQLTITNIKIQSTLCDFSPVKKLDICEDFIKLIAGYRKENIERLPLSLVRQYYPAGTSYRTYEHFTQIIEHDFSQYDYGSKQNLKQYGTQTPPSYNLHLVNAPIYIHFAANDWLSLPEDVKFLVEQLPNVKRVREVPEPSFNHMDFLYAVHAKTLFYDNIIATFINLSDTTA